MKDKAAIIGVIIVALGLGVALVVVNKNASKQQEDDAGRIHSLSNQVVSVNGDYQKQQQVNLALSSNLTSTTASYSNKLTDAEASLRSTQANLDKAQADAKAAVDAGAAAAAAAAAAKAEVAKRDQQITELQTQNADLDKQSADLHNSITNLDGQIAAKEKEIASTKGDNELLQKELETMRAQKQDLEDKFNSLAALKLQLAKIKDQLAVNQRLDWTRRGIYDMSREKGAERLVRQPENLGAAPQPGLNAAIHQGGSVNIISSPTNSLPEAPPPTAK